jgi:hypothetical protein
MMSRMALLIRDLRRYGLGRTHNGGDRCADWCALTREGTIMSRFNLRCRVSTVLSAAVAIASLQFGAAFAVFAQAPSDSNGRYSLAPVDGGFLRLDRETGEVAMCAKSGTAWACEGVEDRARKSADTKKLEAENKLLRDRLQSLETQGKSVAPAPDAVPKAQLPTEEEVDKALDYVENIFKKFKNRIEKYQGPTLPPGETPPADTAPDVPSPPAPKDPAEPKGPSKTL